MRTSIVILVAVLLTGCDPFGTGGATRSTPSVTYQTDSDAYDASGAIDATFTNTSDQDVYLFYDGCFVVNVEQKRESTWSGVSEPIACTQEVKPPVRVGAGESKPAGVSAERVDAADLSSGTYRLRVRTSPSPDFPPRRTVTSNTFEVVR